MLLTINVDKEKLVCVGKFANAIDAHIAKGVLDAQNIESVINNETFASVLPIGFNSIGQVTLWVKASDADRATQIVYEVMTKLE